MQHPSLSIVSTCLYQGGRNGSFPVSYTHLPSPNPIPPFPKTFVFIESLFEKYGGHAGRAAGVPLRGLFSFLGKMLILSGMASSPPRPKRRKSWEGERWGRGGGEREAFLPVSYTHLDVYKRQGNYHVITGDHMNNMKDEAIVCNIGHFDNEIQMARLEASDAVRTNIKPQVDKFTFPVAQTPNRAPRQSCPYPSWTQ